MPRVPRTLVFVAGDQLSANLPSLRAAEPASSVVLMCEVDAETTYVRHHRRKIALILSAMRHFAAQLRAAGWQVDYVTLEDPQNTGSFRGEVARALARHRCGRVLATEGSEWRVREDMRGWEAALAVPVEIHEDTRFLCSHAAFAAWAAGRRQLRMEYFYREMRRRTGFLMEAGQPAGGRWNLDQENRRPARAGTQFPPPRLFTPDAITEEVLALVERRFVDHFGTLRPFAFAVTRDQALAALAHFVTHALPGFGATQDAMLVGEPFLNHSLLSPCLNLGLLDPREVCAAAEQAYRDGHAPLNAVEGFIRQIIGWREYVRGIYWREMPTYRSRNALDATRPLPAFYWTAQTDMACVRHVVEQTRDHAYAHHIQRLMVTGNFALLAGIDPQAVHDWYLAVYADAFEWVELPNTLGMSQFADGGLLGSKPYAASGAYLNRMSDYCKGCAYRVSERRGPRACPFNLLYWDFIARHAARFARSPRMANAVRMWQRFDAGQQAALRAEAAAFLAQLPA